jgi:hypothetical protein
MAAPVKDSFFVKNSPQNNFSSAADYRPTVVNTRSQEIFSILGSIFAQLKNQTIQNSREQVLPSAPAASQISQNFAATNVRHGPLISTNTLPVAANPVLSTGSPGSVSPQGQNPSSVAQPPNSSPVFVSQSAGTSPGVEISRPANTVAVLGFLASAAMASKTSSNSSLIQSPGSNFLNAPTFATSQTQPRSETSHSLMEQGAYVSMNHGNASAGIVTGSTFLSASMNLALVNAQTTAQLLSSTTTLSAQGTTISLPIFLTPASKPLEASVPSSSGSATVLSAQGTTIFLSNSLTPASKPSEAPLPLPSGSATVLSAQGSALTAANSTKATTMTLTLSASASQQSAFGVSSGTSSSANEPLSASGATSLTAPLTNQVPVSIARGADGFSSVLASPATTQHTAAAQQQAANIPTASSSTSFSQGALQSLKAADGMISSNPSAPANMTSSNSSVRHADSIPQVIPLSSAPSISSNGVDSTTPRDEGSAHEDGEEGEEGEEGEDEGEENRIFSSQHRSKKSRLIS